MKLFKLKRKNIILVSLLAIAGFLGISSVAVNTATSKETPLTEKAEAATNKVYFCNAANWSGAQIGMYYWGGGVTASWQCGYSGFDSDFTGMWRFEIPSAATNCKFVRLNSSKTWTEGTITKGWPDPIWNESKSDITLDETKVYVASGYDYGKLTGSWTAYTRYINEYAYFDGYYNKWPAVNGSGGQDGNITTTTRYGAELSVITDPPSVYGYTFDGWYWDKDDVNHSLSNPLDSSARLYGSTETRSIYAKYTRLSTNKTYYICLSKCSSYITNSARAYVRNDSLGKNTWPIAVTIHETTISGLYSFSVPIDASYFVITDTTDGTSYPQKQTINITLSSEHNLYVITSNNSNSNQTGEWKDVVYYIVGDSTFTGSASTAWTIAGGVVMTESKSDNGNAAEATGVVVANNSTVKIYMVYATDTGVSDAWYGQLGTSYTFASNVGDNDIKFSKVGNYSFYLKDGKVWLEDDANKDNWGYIYLSSTVSASEIRVTATNTSSVVTENNARLSSISDCQSVSNLTYNNIKGLHKFPVYNLRGNQTAVRTNTLKISDGTTTKTYTIPNDSSKPVYYIVLSSTAVNKNSDLAYAATVAFDFAKNVSSATNSSVCNISQTKAKSLVDQYDALTSSHASAIDEFEDSLVTTWDSTKPTYEGSRNVPMTAILYQVSKIAADGKNRGILGRFGGLSLFGSEDNFSTIIIIISSSVALLSVTALSILVIRKRKSKED